MAFKLILVNRSIYGIKYPCCNIDVVPLIMPFEDPMSCQKSVPKTLCKNSPKNPQKSGAKIQQKSFMISLTKNLLKTLNISKNFLILHSTQPKQKTHARINHTQLPDEVRYYRHNHRQRRTSLLQSSDKNLYSSCRIRKEHEPSQDR